MKEKKQINNTQDEEQILNISLRPNKLSEFVGQKRVIEGLAIGVKAALKRKEPIDHVLFSGPQGLGKTTLAHAIAHEMSSNIVTSSGPGIDRAGDLVGILTNLNEGDIFFIDEIHRLSKAVEEFLYSAMENFKIDFIIDKGPYARTIKFHLKRFTLIGATTRSGLLSAPLRARFGIYHHLDFYESDELAQIVKRSAKLLDIPVEEEAALMIAKCSRGTPRIANRILRRVRDYAQVKSNGNITSAVVSDALEKEGIDNLGLNHIDRKVLLNIIEQYKGGPVGIDALVSVLNEEPDTIIDVVEPYLLKAGFLKRTKKGREVTELAYKHLNVKKENNLF
ncbi:MAG TPA: Holliday junction branch migration DNA helicase RuvB [Candidatus Omnitrophica bacterium]|nr:Holliday junction branch migration DNA helicase RuvB [Candidatus Omnitrophota bacterium]